MTVTADASFKHDDEIDIVLFKAKELLTNSILNVTRTKMETSNACRPGHCLILKNLLCLQSGYRTLAAAKMYTIIQHFYASKNGMIKKLGNCYREAIPKFIGAKDSLEYCKAVAEFHAYTQDSHGFIARSNEWFSLRLNRLIQDRGAFMCHRYSLA